MCPSSSAAAEDITLPLTSISSSSPSSSSFAPGCTIAGDPRSLSPSAAPPPAACCCSSRLSSSLLLSPLGRGAANVPAAPACPPVCCAGVLLAGAWPGVAPPAAAAVASGCAEASRVGVGVPRDWLMWRWSCMGSNKPGSSGRSGDLVRMTWLAGSRAQRRVGHMARDGRAPPLRCTCHPKTLLMGSNLQQQQASPCLCCRALAAPGHARAGQDQRGRGRGRRDECQRLQGQGRRCTGAEL